MKTWLHAYIRRATCLFAALGLFTFTACGDTPQAAPVSEEDEARYYSMKLRDVPDPEEALYGWDFLKPYEDWKKTGGKMSYQNGVPCRRFLLLSESEPALMESCLQVFRQDSWSWEQYPLNSLEWAEGRYLAANRLAGAEESGFLFELSEMTVEGNIELYLGHYDGTETEILMPWPEEAEQMSVCRDREGNAYFYSEMGNTVYIYDSGGKFQKRTVLDGLLWGGVCNPVTGDMLWYGCGDGEARLWTAADSHETAQGVALEFRAAYAPDGTLYYGDTEGLWVGGANPRRLLSFLDKGYSLQKLYSLRVLENGDIQCYASLDDSLCQVSLHRETEPVAEERQEITLYRYFPDSDPFLERVITRFNRYNPQYHVTYLETVEDSRFRAELSAGKGPDLLVLPWETAEEYIEQGYLREMEGIVEQPELFLEAALESGRLNGRTYGIPYRCNIRFPAFSRKITGDRESWTVEEMIQCVRGSDAKVLDWYFSQMDVSAIVLEYGLRDDGNTAYIDWEKGESHLTEPPFAELLEFAAEYADTGDYDRAETFSLMQEGYIAGSTLYLQNLGELERAEECFNGDVSYIGYPDSAGEGGIYARVNCLYLNQASDRGEGAAEFARFILSDEAQRLHVTDRKFCDGLPVRLETFDYLIGLEREKAAAPGTMHSTDWGKWQEDGLDEEQLALIGRILTQAQPDRPKVAAVEDIIREELEPYAQGARSLEETVRILDNRIQIYLDERGSKE